MKIFITATLLLAFHTMAASVAPHLRGKEDEQRALKSKSVKVDICHIPPRNPSKFHTINISQKALQEHLDHGDLLGLCSAHCNELCADGNMCETWKCEDRNCIRYTDVDCDDGFDSTEDVCDVNLGCIRKIVAPNNLKNLDGLDGSDLSFCLEAFNEIDLRQQNFYSSDQFQDLPGPMLITEVALRITRIKYDGPEFPPLTGPIIYPQTITFDAEFRLSTTPPVELQKLSTTFSDNYRDGAAVTVLRDKKWVLKTNGNDPDLEWGIPNPFDIIIKLDTPYLYDPSQGNLNFEYLIRRLETINCSRLKVNTGESTELGPYIDGTPYNSPEYFNKVRLLYSFDVESPEGEGFEDIAPVVKFTFAKPPAGN